jgi:hypothetical protein
VTVEVVAPTAEFQPERRVKMIVLGVLGPVCTVFVAPAW